jgi:hypothetical protein
MVYNPLIITFAFRFSSLIQDEHQILLKYTVFAIFDSL